MSKIDKDKIIQEKATNSQEVVLGLLVSVAKGDLNMAVAESKLHDYVKSLPEDQQADFRFKARTWGRLVVSVAEAFNQQLAVIAADQ